MAKSANNHKNFQDVEKIIKLRQASIPQSKEYLFDYKLETALQNRNTYSREEFTQLYKIDFEDLYLSQPTSKALRLRNFKRMTEIQRCVLPHALAARDILGASRTGSGKTLAYLIPILENLYVKKWSPFDGLGAIILLPTRELAMQVFEVLKSISASHILNIGLLIGGKNYEYEKQRVPGMNILICTPGRLLQHLEESPFFECNSLQMLVLDEADLMLEMGFWGAIKTILSYLPKERQTMLFSATLTQSIHQLSKLSLRHPEQIFLHATKDKDQAQGDSQFATPNKLVQFYVVAPAEEKIDLLFSFLRAHANQKVVIFASTCKQVRFLFESFRKLKVGLPLLELHGRQKQEKRTAIFFTFTEKRAAALFTTNIASRGLDFPKVDWVIQYDCADDVETYVHRVGRTARYNAGGFSLLMILPSEQPFIEKLHKKGIEIKQKFLNSGKQLTIKNSLQSLVSQNIDLKYLAQRAFISYMRSIDVNPDKQVFNVKNIRADLLAESFGLVQVPVISYQEEDEEGEQGQAEPEAQNQKKSKLQKLKEKIEMKKQMAAEAHKPPEKKLLKQLQRESDFGKFEKMQFKADSNLEGGLLRKKEQQEEIEELEQPQFVTSRRQMKKVKVDGIFGGRNKVFFDEQGNQITADEKARLEIEKQQQAALEEDRTSRYALKLLEHQEEDKAHELERRKAKRQKRKQLEQQQLQ